MTTYVSTEQDKPIRRAAGSSKRADWMIPAGLIVLSLVPAAAGVMRIAGLAGGETVTPENARFVASPLPVVIHIITALIFSLVGAFQFTTGFGRKRLGWHRAAGQVLVMCGLGAALSGLWMTLFYPKPPGVGGLLTAFRIVFGSGMALSMVLGYVKARQRQIGEHQAWMMRGYAIGLGAGTQVLTFMPYFILLGEPNELTRALLMALGWVINLAVAEWVIWRKQPNGR